MKDKIRFLINTWCNQEKYQLCHGTKISQELKISRNIVAKALNELFEENVLIKIRCRPIIFLDKEYLEKKYQKNFKKSEFDQLEEVFKFLSDDIIANDFNKLIGHDESMNQIVEKIKATVSYPPLGLPILLYGPTGTGKSFMAKLTYEYCLNQKLIEANAKFVQVNCSEYANNPELLTANLFGYKKGAFTGADKDNLGLLHHADGGILFLDEVHCLKAECQEKLFLYMDQGIYHLLGDNDNWYKSRCRIIFATTEQPEKVLLKTLLRRIPVLLTIPSLEQRGINEKLELIYSLYKSEEKRINKQIKISSNVYQLLLSYQFVGNIGELSNVIQASCVSALFKNEGGALEIHAYDLPENIVEALDANQMTMQKYQMVSLDALVPASRKNMIINFYENILSVVNNQDFYQEIKKIIDEYFEKIIFNKRDTYQNKYFLDTVSKVFDIVTGRYGFHMSHNELIAISSYFLEYNNNAYDIINWVSRNEERIVSLQKHLQLKYHQEYLISLEAYEYFKDNLNNHLDILVLCIITICLVKYINHEINDMSVAIILAHGYSTASSIAESVNKLLDTYVFDAIDMPLDVDSIEVTRKINEYIASIGKINKLYLLVDMGSLEEIYQGIEVKNIDMALINNVNTKLALTIGQGIIQKQTMKEIFATVEQENLYNLHLELNYQKEPVILCSCASGMGTANKLKEIILASLPEEIKLKVITYDYPTLIQNYATKDFLNDYNVVCVIGTLNPNIADLNFIAIEDLILNSGTNQISKYFKQYLDKDQLELFEKNILKNFSLSNVMNNLTILNPNKLLEHVSSGLDKLQEILNVKFKNQTCFGLYVHICCLVERLVTRQAIESFVDIDFEKEHRDFINMLKQAMREVETFYNVEIPSEEIEYIYEYVKNDQHA